MDDSLHDRGRAMEDLFFNQKDQELLERMRSELAASESREGLKTVSGIEDAAVLDALSAAGVTPESLTSVALIPLVAVAWADKKMESAEKAAILQAANQAGIRPDTASYKTMEAWLSALPSDDLLVTWKAYIAAVKGGLEPAAFEQLKTTIVGRAETIAESAGGFLGLGDKISDDERKVLDDLASAFE